MLVSFDKTVESTAVSDSENLKKKLHVIQKNEISNLRSRVSHLESLLSANLETLSN